jgi:hypothetical protein
VAVLPPESQSNPPQATPPTASRFCRDNETMGWRERERREGGGGLGAEGREGERARERGLARLNLASSFASKEIESSDEE